MSWVEGMWQVAGLPGAELQVQVLFFVTEFFKPLDICQTVHNIN
jgi:hypothetical protein